MTGLRGDLRRAPRGPQLAKRRVLALLDAHIRRRLCPDASQAASPPLDGRGLAHEGDA